MKKFYRILALLLALCLFCTATSAAGITEEEEHAHGIVEEGVEEAEEAESPMPVSVYEPAASTGARPKLRYAPFAGTVSVLAVPASLSAGLAPSAPPPTNTTVPASTVLAA